MLQPLLQGMNALVQQGVVAAVPSGLNYLGPVLATPADLQKYLPDVASAANLLQTLTRPDRTKALRDRLTWLKTARDILRTSAASAGYDLDVLEKIEQVARSMTPLPWPITGGQGPIGDWTHRLRPKRGNTGAEQLRTDRAWQLLQQEDGKPVKFQLEDFAKSAQDAARLLLEIRCLYEVYARYAVAVRTAIETGQPMARVLALWRIEGDMNVPPSMSSLKGLDVPAVAGRRLELPPGRSAFTFQLTPTPHFATMACLVLRSHFATEDEARALMNALFHLVLMGLDILFVDAYRVDVNGTQLTREHWLALNWQKPGQSLADAQNAAMAAFNLRPGQLLLEAERQPPPVGGPLAYVGTPANPVEYTAGIVGEGVRYLARLARNEHLFPGRAGDLPEVLAYLTYHQGFDKTKTVIASALAHAVSGGSAPARPLKALIKASTVPGLETTLQGVRSAPTTDAAVNLVKAQWAAQFVPLLSSPANVSLVADYILGAPSSEWSSWDNPVRTNIIRYAHLVRFYTLLLS